MHTAHISITSVLLLGAACGASPRPAPEVAATRTIEDYETIGATAQDAPTAEELTLIALPLLNDDRGAKSVRKFLDKITLIDAPGRGAPSTDGYRFVGAIVRIDRATGKRHPYCTATAVDRGHILTAAHCLYDVERQLRVDRTGDRYFVVLAPDAYRGPLVHELTAPVVPVGYDGTAALDLGIATVAPAFPAGMTYPALATTALPRGAAVRKIGYGLWTDHSADTAPIRRIGRKARADMTVSTILAGGVRFDYVPLDPPRGAICNGDSGGPSLIIDRGLFYVVGVTHGSLDPNAACHEGGIDTLVPGEGARWIKTAVGSGP